MEDFFIPTLHTFAMNNVFTGSVGDFRFKITPNIQKITPKEVDFATSTILAECWHGQFCYEKSTIEGQNTFPLTETGRSEMLSWLKEQI